MNGGFQYIINNYKLVSYKNAWFVFGLIIVFEKFDDLN